MKKLTSILILLFISFATYGQEKIKVEGESEEVKIYFGHDSHIINTDFKGNKESLYSSYDLIKQLLSDTLSIVAKIEINGYASPEGNPIYNIKLAKNRTEAVYDYLTHAISVPDSLIVKKSSGINWRELDKLVSVSNIEYRDEVLNIIRNTPEVSRDRQLRDLQGGEPYRYMIDNIYPQLRYGSIITVYLLKKATPLIIKKIEKQEPKPEVKEVIVPSAETCKPPLQFALKTNLLYDLLLAPSIEVEVPIGERFSVAGEWIFPWWVTKDNGNALQILSGQLEGRYWFGDRTEKPKLTGWFAGLYAGGGLYDLQWKNNGYQGEFYIAAGLSGGYAHTINKKGNLRMEYSLGLGYLNTKYRYYEGAQDNQYLVWQHDGNYSWVGPTKAKVSLVWLINWKRGGDR